MTDKPILGVDIGTISSIFRNERGLIYLASTCLPSIVKKVNRKINSENTEGKSFSSYLLTYFLLNLQKSTRFDR